MDIYSFKVIQSQEDISEEVCQSWLIQQVSRITGLALNQIDITQPFSSYGIDSVAATGLSDDLANWLGKRLEPTITWDYPSIRLLAHYLASNSKRQALTAA